MQNRDTNQLVTGRDLRELFEKVPPKSRGPVFEVNEVVEIKGYLYRLTQINDSYGGSMTFIPQGPLPPKKRPRRAKGKRP